MTIKVLGMGCAKCTKLEENVKAAIVETGVEAQVEKVEDISKIMAYGVMSTPGLVVDERVVSKGKLLSVEEVKKILK